MNAANLLKWIEELETTEAEQGQIYLQKDGAFCCLGILCEVAIANGVPLAVEADNGEEGVMDYDLNACLLPAKAASWVDATGFDVKLEDGSYEDVIEANDGLRLSFAEIAAGLRRRYADEIAKVQS